MPISHIDHYNICVPVERLEELSRFYVEALGFTVGERPPFRSVGRWLYADGQPLLHITGYTPDAATEAAPDTGLFSHVALKCRDFAAMLARLEALGIAYEVEDVPLLGQRQIFLTDPAGVGVELNFDARS